MEDRIGVALLFFSNSADIGSSGRRVQKGIQQILGKYAGKGIIIDYVIIGHIHFANVTDVYTRSGSLCGNNTYSDRALNLITRASQVMHTITSTIPTVSRLNMLPMPNAIFGAVRFLAWLSMSVDMSRAWTSKPRSL